jgi:hypothetical protein
MRHTFPVLAILGAIAAQPAVAQNHCALPADQAAFEIHALNTHLRVLAIGCSDDARYAAFVRKFQPDLAANDKAVTAWFKRRYGGRGQFEQDKFVTDLSNAVSDGHTVLGGDLCPHDGMMFTEVMALRSSADLAPYAAAKDLIPPSVEICPGQQAGGAKAAAKAPAKPSVKH